jgi:Spy/CpxP family protein refolding chaperone
MAKFVVILGFILSFAAGMVIGSKGVLVSEAPANPTPSSPTTQSSRDGGGRRSPSGYLTAELGLSPEQRDRLDKIWSAVAKANDQDDRRRGYRRERDEAIADLVPPERLGDYDRVIEHYQNRVEALEQTSREAYRTAVEQTKQILTPEQRARYEALLKRHNWGPGARDRHGKGGETRATSQPGRADSPSSSPSPSHN